MKNIYKAQSINIYDYSKKLWFKHYLIARYEDLKLILQGLLILLVILTYFLILLIFPILATILLFSY